MCCGVPTSSGDLQTQGTHRLGVLGYCGSVVVATSLDCARDLQGVVAFGRKNGTGVDYRKKMLELFTLGCATTMDSGTPMVDATRYGQFVSFKSYPSNKAGVALAENVRWPQ